MKYIMLLLLSVSVMAQDNFQQVNSPRGGLSFRGISPDVNRGPAGYKVVRFWSQNGVGTIDNIVDLEADFSFTITPGNPLYEQFVIRNAASELPIFVGPIVASFGLPVKSNVGTTIQELELRYDPLPGFAGDEIGVVTFTSNGNAYARDIITFHVDNTLPILTLSASPSLIPAGFSTTLNPVAIDADGHAVSISYNYGDGSSGTNPAHTYAAAGSYIVTATANDGFGTTMAQTSITVVGTSHIPTARFNASDIVAFVNVPFVLDGITSTDEQNSIVSYSWNFGDDTPLGSVATLSHIYKNVGLVTVTLTVTDAEGFSSTVSREVEVLSEQAAATFDSEIRVTSTFYPLKLNKDIVTVFARVNIGDTKLADGSAVALEYGGKRFAATLNKRLKATGWTVKQNLRRQTPGTVEITFKARNTAVASLLTALGAVDGGTVDIPFRLELGPKTILVDIVSDFEIGLARGKGQGELE